MRINFADAVRFLFFQYCDNNIGLFSIAPCKVIALTLLVLV